VIVAGQGSASVCYDCVRVLGQLISSKNHPKPCTSMDDPDLAPRSIRDNLDQYVIGQQKDTKRSCL
jgi:ATP-dependent protease Clp ATPase subunit